MPSGLVALLDDVSVIARAAAASLDDVGAAAGKAGAKAAGVVIDDAAVTPSYVTGFTPDRELPVIFRIARGSLRNKLLFLLPIALILSEFLPGAVVPLLMLGGLYLSFEGAEKVMEKLGGDKHGETLDGPVGDVAAFEHQRVAGAVRTDFILSAEIMAIALAEVSGQGLIARAIILAIVGILITIAVYGAVGVIVKMDDIGLHLARRPGAGAMTRRFGRMLVAAMAARDVVAGHGGHGGDAVGRRGHPAPRRGRIGVPPSGGPGTRHPARGAGGRGARGAGRRCRLAGLCRGLGGGWAGRGHGARDGRPSLRRHAQRRGGLIGPRGTPQQ